MNRGRGNLQQTEAAKSVACIDFKKRRTTFNDVFSSYKQMRNIKQRALKYPLTQFLSSTGKRFVEIKETKLTKQRASISFEFNVG